MSFISEGQVSKGIVARRLFLLSWLSLGLRSWLSLPPLLQLRDQLVCLRGVQVASADDATFRDDRTPRLVGDGQLVLQLPQAFELHDPCDVGLVLGWNWPVGSGKGMTARVRRSIGSQFLGSASW